MKWHLVSSFSYFVLLRQRHRNVRRIPVNLVNVLLWYFYSLTGILSSGQNSFIPETREFILF
jgi:hypothetical protein